MSKLGDPTHRFKQLSSRPLERILRRSSLGRVSVRWVGFPRGWGALGGLGGGVKSRLRYVGVFFGGGKKTCWLRVGQAPFSLLNGRANEKLV